AAARERIREHYRAVLTRGRRDQPETCELSCTPYPRWPPPVGAAPRESHPGGSRPIALALDTPRSWRTRLVAVWTVQQLTTFLDFVVKDRLYPALAPAPHRAATPLDPVYARDGFPPTGGKICLICSDSPSG